MKAEDLIKKLEVIGLPQIELANHRSRLRIALLGSDTFKEGREVTAMETEKLIETNRLIIRYFTPADWKGVQALAIDKETHKRDPQDPPWPTSDDGCQGFAEYMARMTDRFFAVCLKRDQTLLGLLAFNGIDTNKQLDLGYQIQSKYQDNDHDKEALESIIDFAFKNKDILSIETRTNSEWTEQLAPLKSLGFTPIKGDPGNLGITRDVWENREIEDNIATPSTQGPQIEPSFQERGPFRVLGVEDDAYKIDEVDPGFSDLWMNRFMSRHDDDVQPYSTDGAYYAVWFGATADTSLGKHLAGMAVTDDAKAPAGWVIREVPAAEYAVFETTLRDVGDATEYALDQWLPWPDYELDTTKPRFDLMPPDTTGPWTPVTIWVPVKKIESTITIQPPQGKQLDWVPVSRGQGNWLARGLETILDYLGDGTDYDTIMGDSGQAFIMQGEEDSINLIDGAVDVGWWPLHPLTLIRHNFLEKTVGRELFDICTLTVGQKEFSSLYNQWFKPVVESSIAANKPCLAQIDCWFVVTGYDDGEPPLIGERAVEGEPKVGRIEDGWPFSLVAPGEPVHRIDREEADLEAVKYAIALHRDQVLGANVEYSGKYPLRGAGRFSQYWRTGLKSLNSWIQCLQDTEHLGQNFWHSNVLLNLFYNRSSAMRYLKAMQKRQPQTVADYLESAIQKYNAVIGVLGSVDWSIEAMSSVKGRETFAAQVRDIASLETEAVAELEKAVEVLA